jgi:osmotically-inducible protein OsmY
MKTDEILRNDVIDELHWDPKLRDISTQIGVASKAGVISLSGNVRSYPEKMAAEHAAQRVAGVKVVASGLKVRLNAEGKKDDIQIAEAVGNALRFDPCVNEDQVEVKVENGWVIMEGTVDWSFQKLAAQKCVENLPFIMGVINNVIVKEKTVDTKEMQKKIAAAFHRAASLDSSTITIEARDNRITLHGTVKSLLEKRTAEDIAWSYPGVVVVTNEIHVDSQPFLQMHG